MSTVNYRLRVFGRLIGELEVESDGLEIHIEGMSDDNPSEHLHWCDTQESDPVEMEPQSD